MTGVLCDAWCVERRRTEAARAVKWACALRIARPLKRCTRLKGKGRTSDEWTSV